MRVSCLIPAHNEAPRVGAVLDAALTDEAAAPSQTLSVPRAPRAVKSGDSETG